MLHVSPKVKLTLTGGGMRYGNIGKVCKGIRLTLTGRGLEYKNMCLVPKKVKLTLVGIAVWNTESTCRPGDHHEMYAGFSGN